MNQVRGRHKVGMRQTCFRYGLTGLWESFLTASGMRGKGRAAMAREKRPASMGYKIQHATETFSRGEQIMQAMVQGREKNCSQQKSRNRVSGSPHSMDARETPKGV